MSFQRTEAPMRLLAPLLLLISSIAWSQGLSGDSVSTFIDSLEPVTSYAEGLDPEVRDGLMSSDILPQSGEPLRPYSRSLEYVREEHAQVYETMGGIVGEHGFSSLEQWADTGDRVMVAWLALQMEGNDMGQITPE